ncbi:DegT/DnrJ/EryC1/StrS family aminotransferase [Patescibacteria group bacterium]|nr:DegT/DnrJ/EryC1/StrS family aminotransferase [Patescibacteria group bacterium]
MTTGDGGMLVTNNKDYYEKIKKLRWVGMDKDTFDRKADNNYARYYNIDCL